jgi:hypothetical protein
VERGYHSTAMLLPDARVLTGGGESSELRVFCPPYLFKADGSLAPRPQILGAPSSVTWRKTFTVCVADTTGIRGACFIRPAATTHAFDQNQRFVPLTITGQAGNPQRVFVTAPASPDSAPPGDYLLFLTGSKQGATAYPDVPSIAKWVRLEPPGLDLCDQVDPGTITDLTPDLVGPTEAWFLWTGPGDDGSLAPSGAPEEFDLRASLGPIQTPAAWDQASPRSIDETLPPGTAGSLGSGTVQGLQACTWYHAAVRARDDNQHLSGLHADVMFETVCGGGGGGGGFSARRVDGNGEGASAAGAVSALNTASAEAAATVSPAGAGEAPLAGATGLVPAAGALVAETRRRSEGGWQVILRMVSEPEGLDPALAGGIVSQVRDARGGWKTLGRYQPTPGQSPLGLCALRDQGRVVFPAGYALDRVVSSLRAGSQDHALNLADHSRLGPLGEGFISSGGGVEMALGDALTLTYAPSGEAVPGATSWYLMVRPAGMVGPSATPARREQGSAIPQHFALHPNQPNPSGTSTVIRYDLPVASPVRLQVFDLLGRKVATLTEGRYPAGFHAVAWDLRDASGAPVRPGVYIYRLVAGDFHARRKMSILP